MSRPGTAGNLMTVMAVSKVADRMVKRRGTGSMMSSRYHTSRPQAALSLILALALSAALALSVALPVALPTQAQAGGTAQAAALVAPGAPAAICVSAGRKHRRLAARMSRRIAAALRGRSSVVGLAVADTRTGVTCKLHQWRPFHSASIVKVIILGALLRHLMVVHRQLTPEQVTLTTAMITESSNSAATELWDELGRRRLQRFLDLAKMTHTRLGQGGFWGLTWVIAHDELLLLKVIKARNSVLDWPSRVYALSLMARVIPSERWGVTAGAPADMTAHVKNGWLPDPDLWVINSIGVFTGRHRTYRIVVLTRDNPSMTYGVDTIQGVAEVINHQLNPGVTEVIPPSAPYPSWGTPDERILPPARR